MQIGTLETRIVSGHKELCGSIQTLNHDLEFRLVPNHLKSSERAPSHRILSPSSRGGEVEIGSAWTKEYAGADGEPEAFFSLTFDDPSFETPLNVAAFPDRENEGNYFITWRRRQNRQQSAQQPNAA